MGAYLCSFGFIEVRLHLERHPGVAMPQEPIRVAIVEDDRPTREALALLINGTPGYCCDQAYRSVEQGIESIRGSGPDVILLDIHLPGTLGSEGVKLFRDKFPSTQVLMLTIYEE